VDDRSTPRASHIAVALAGAALAIAGVAFIAAGVTFGASGGMMGGGSRFGSGGMMGGGSWNQGAQPGVPGFVAGTVAAPRAIRVLAGPAYAFTPSSIAVARGETVTFVVTAMGPFAHEFMVGPADTVAADIAGTPEIADIGMMSTKSLTYTFDGPGPYAFACHAPGHYEAGMRGAIVVVP